MFTVYKVLFKKGGGGLVYPILIFKGMEFPCKPGKKFSSQLSSAHMTPRGGKYKI
jgi:hypothetical protein